jgi:uncharacterized protein (DUF58 family)
MDWLESRWATPSYSGWLLFALSCCFFGAATNTMAGWLYVLSGMIFSLLAIGAIMPVRSLRQLKLERFPLKPVSAGEDLTIEISIKNPTKIPKTLLQVWDVLPENLGLVTTGVTSINLFQIIISASQFSMMDFVHKKTNTKGLMLMI